MQRAQRAERMKPPGAPGCPVREGKPQDTVGRGADQAGGAEGETPMPVSLKLSGQWRRGHLSQRL